MKSLGSQLKLKSLVIVYVEFWAKGNASIYYKATEIKMQNLTVTGEIVIVVHTLILI